MMFVSHTSDTQIVPHHMPWRPCPGTQHSKTNAAS